MIGGTNMASFIIILIVTILSEMYVERLIDLARRDSQSFSKSYAGELSECIVGIYNISKILYIPFILIRL